MLNTYLRIDNPERYFETFGSFYPNALPSYLNGLITLGEEGKKIIENDLIPFVASVLDGNFKTKRYTKSPTLDAIAAKNPNLIDAWKDSSSETMLTLDSSSEESFAEKLKSISQDVSKILPFFTTDPSKFIAMNKTLTEQLQKIKKECPEKKTFRLQKNLIQLQNPKLTPKQKRSLLTSSAELLVDLNILPSLKTLIDQETEIFETKQKEQSKKYICIDSDDPLHLFLSGTYTEGSCQNTIGGDPKLNKCLLGYTNDGKNRILVVSDESGTIIGRAIFRLLMDERGDPILFLEDSYPKSNKSLEKILIIFATQRAKALGLPLLAKKIGSGSSYPYKVVSKTSKSTYEFVDALLEIGNSGIVEDDYTVDGAHLLWSPSIK